MIYQCYFRPEQRASLFGHAPYAGFGLEPEVNATLLQRCPELADAATRTALTEYAAFLHVWRNFPHDRDYWIGFTSWRQRDKSDFEFESAEQVEDLLQGHDFLAWHWLSLRGLRHGELTGAAAQGELSSPLLWDFTCGVLQHFDIEVPRAYFDDTEAAFANYWVLRKPDFTAYMHWSWPLVRHALAMPHAYKEQDHSCHPRDDRRKAVGYFMERLFLIWVMRRGLHGRRLGTLRDA